MNPIFVGKTSSIFLINSALYFTPVRLSENPLSLFFIVNCRWVWKASSVGSVPSFGFYFHLGRSLSACQTVKLPSQLPHCYLFTHLTASPYCYSCFSACLGAKERNKYTFVYMYICMARRHKNLLPLFRELCTYTRPPFGLWVAGGPLFSHSLVRLHWLLTQIPRVAVVMCEPR